MAIEISLTDFVEFVIKSGSPKLTLVKQIKHRPDYHPSTDYYKVLRDKLEDFHKTNAEKKELDKVLDDVFQKSKLNNYKDIILAYKSFLGRKHINWFKPPFKHWKHNELDIRLNPELGLEIDGQKYLIKLYFKAESITKNRVELILTLLNKEFLTKKNDYKVAILDIRAKKLHSDEKLDVDVLLPLLMGEANSFETIWKTIK